MRTEPPVSDPSANSTSPAATAEADPQLEPPGKRSGAAGVTRRAVPHVLTGKPVGQLDGLGLALQLSARCPARRRRPGRCPRPAAWVRAQSGLP